MTLSPGDGLEFPLLCHYRIIAEDLPNMGMVIETVVRGCGVDSPLKKGNRSDQGKYITFNMDVTVTSKEMMNKLDAELRNIQGVKMVL